METRLKPGVAERSWTLGLARQADEEMTGYVATRWYRAPKIMLNWMHYSQTGDGSARGRGLRGVWRARRPGALGTGQVLRTRSSESRAPQLLGWTLALPRALRKGPGCDRGAVAQPPALWGGLGVGRLMATPFLLQWTSGPWAASWLSCSRERPLPRK